MLFSILKAVGALAVLGVAASSMLAVAARKFHVEVDPLVESLASALPGANCGACGRPSCFAMAEAMASGDAPATGCVAGGKSVAEAVSGLLGSGSCDVVAVVSARHCGGGINAVRSYEYGGIRSCNGVARMAGGPLVCTAGCFGFGDCLESCPFDAISMDNRGLPVIDVAKCTGCGICVRECPRGQISLLELVPDNAPVVVRCNAHDKPKARKSGCSTCCIACKKCEKECPADAIHVIDLLAIVDYEKCTGCGTCVTVCPQNCIDVYASAVVSSPEADGRGKDAVQMVPSGSGVSSGE